MQTQKLGASSKGAAEDEGPCVGQPGSQQRGGKCHCGDVVPQHVYLNVSSNLCYPQAYANFPRSA